MKRHQIITHRTQHSRHHHSTHLTTTTHSEKIPRHYHPPPGRPPLFPVPALASHIFANSLLGRPLMSPSPVPLDEVDFIHQASAAPIASSSCTGSISESEIDYIRWRSRAILTAHFRIRIFISPKSINPVQIRADRAKINQMTTFINPILSH